MSHQNHKEMKPEQIPLYDLTNLKNQTGNDDEFLQQMVALFITQIGEQIEKMKIAVQQKDWAEIRFIVHKMKSAVTIFGIKSLRGLIHEIEIMIPDNIDENKITGNLETIENVLQQCIKQLKMEFNSA